MRVYEDAHGSLEQWYVATNREGVNKRAEAAPGSNAGAGVEHGLDLIPDGSVGHD